MKCSILAAVTAASLIFPSAALARPEIDVDKATTFHEKKVATFVENWNIESAEMMGTEPPLEGEDVPTFIIEYYTESCDQETRYRALCWSSTTFSDGTLCEGDDEVIVNRRGKYTLAWTDDEDSCTE